MINAEKVEETRKTKGSGWRRLALLLGAIIAAALLIRFTNLASYLTLGNLHGFREGAGIFAPLIFIAAYAVGTVFAFPGTLLTLSGGLLFGTLAGTALVVIGPQREQRWPSCWPATPGAHRFEELGSTG